MKTYINTIYFKPISIKVSGKNRRDANKKTMLILSKKNIRKLVDKNNSYMDEL